MAAMLPPCKMYIYECGAKGSLYTLVPNAESDVSYTRPWCHRLREHEQRSVLGCTWLIVDRFMALLPIVRGKAISIEQKLPGLYLDNTMRRVCKKLLGSTGPDRMRNESPLAIRSCPQQTAML